MLVLKLILRWMWRNLTFVAMVALMGLIAWLFYSRDYWMVQAAEWETKSKKWYETATFWHQKAVGLTGELKESRDSTVAVQLLLVTANLQASEATTIAYAYQAKYEGAVADKNRVRKKLTHQEQQAAYFQGLVNNQTLSPIYVRDNPNLNPADSVVVEAGLATVDNERIARENLADLQKSVATRDAQINRLRSDNHDIVDKNQRLAGSQLSGENKLRNLAKRKPLFSKTRRKQAAQDADLLQAERERNTVAVPGMEVPTGLENELNQKGRDPRRSNL